VVIQATDQAGLDAAIAKAKSYIEDQLNAVGSDPYALNIISYALTLARSSRASDAVNLLSALAITEGTLRYIYDIR